MENKNNVIYYSQIQIENNFTNYFISCKNILQKEKENQDGQRKA